MADISITPDGNNSALLLELMKGQQAAATEMRLQNTRLFGGDGQEGSIKFILDQHKELALKLDTSKNELLARIDKAKEDLLLQMDGQKKEIDDDIEKVREAGLETDRKVSRVITIGGTLNAVFFAGMAALGLWHRSH